jgi:hypothetical protein
LPAPMASTTAAGLVTASPPAKHRDRGLHADGAGLDGLAAGPLGPLRSRRHSRSMRWPMAEMTVSAQ